MFNCITIHIRFARLYVKAFPPLTYQYYSVVAQIQKQQVETTLECSWWYDSDLKPSSSQKYTEPGRSGKLQITTTCLVSAIFSMHIFFEYSAYFL